MRLSATCIGIAGVIATQILTRFHADIAAIVVVLATRTLDAKTFIVIQSERTRATSFIFSPLVAKSSLFKGYFKFSVELDTEILFQITVELHVFSTKKKTVFGAVFNKFVPLSFFKNDLFANCLNSEITDFRIKV